MELVSTRPLALARADIVLPGLLGALASIAVVGLAPPGGDTAAHLYRTELVRDGAALWDNLWFAGHYPLASYSLLYYLPAALVGNVPLVVGAVVATAALFAALAHAEWGDAARWPARAFAVLAAGPLFTGTYSYALGLAAALAALRLLQLGRPWLGIGSAALTLGFSPLAFAFLCLALGAVVLARRRLDVRVAAGLAALGAAQLLVLAAFPSEGRYPFSSLSLAAALGTSGLAAALAARAPGGRLLAAFFVLWGLVCATAFLVTSPFGDNLTRLRGVVFPLVLLAAAVARFRPRSLALAALAVALVYNFGPDVSALPKRAGDARTAEESFWAPALGFLRTHPSPVQRVEVVPTFGHWEAWWVPRAGFALARGWYRQLDIAQNPELYRTPLSAAAYRGWLARMGVRFVLLPQARLGPLGARDEANLLRSGHSGLVEVFRSRDWRIYEVPHARPLLTGPAEAEIVALSHNVVSGRVGAAGSYRLRIRYTPYWRVERGSLCLARAADGMTRIVARAPGRFELAVDSRPWAHEDGC
jgi:hypothetical protein